MLNEILFFFKAVFTMKLLQRSSSNLPYQSPKPEIISVRLSASLQAHLGSSGVVSDEAVADNLETAAAGFLLSKRGLTAVEGRKQSASRGYLRLKLHKTQLPN